MSKKIEYIPKDLNDCFIELDKLLESEDVEELKNGTKEDTMMEHHFLGRHLRNNWGLWKGSRLSKWFNEKGIYHADDMSAIILDSYWRYLNLEPIELDEQIEHYKKYWEEANGNNEKR